VGWLQVMRIVVEAPGWAGTLCAPREILVERVLKLDDVSVAGVGGWSYLLTGVLLTWEGG
jgi:hypothetical protein